jgi:hypothetical protein
MNAPVYRQIDDHQTKRARKTGALCWLAMTGSLSGAAVAAPNTPAYRLLV